MAARPSDASRITLVLAQPHELVLDAFSRLLEQAGFDVVCCCTTPECLARCTPIHRPELALVDDALGVHEVTATVRAAFPEVKVVVLASSGLDPELARETLALEVDGVLLKSASCDDVAAGLRRVAAGDAVFPCGWLAAAHRAERDSALAPLSVRQRQVLELLAEGLPNEAIAGRLYISRNTVKFHVAAIYERLGVGNRVEAARRFTALQNGG